MRQKSAGTHRVPSGHSELPVLVPHPGFEPDVTLLRPNSPFFGVESRAWDRECRQRVGVC